MDTSITIRTFAIKGRRVAFQAGGGIVADSDPAAEYEETLDKARALIEALRGDAMILLIDNYDSFVWNLARYVSELGHTRIVVRNDATSLDDIAALAPSAHHRLARPLLADRGRDQQRGDHGVRAADRRSWASASATSASARRWAARSSGRGGRCTARPRASATTAAGVFAGLPEPLRVTRYHSLIVLDEDLPAELRVTARSEEGEIMALAHREWPLVGRAVPPRGRADRARA